MGFLVPFISIIAMLLLLHSIQLQFSAQSKQKSLCSSQDGSIVTIEYSMMYLHTTYLITSTFVCLIGQATTLFTSWRQEEPVNVTPAIPKPALKLLSQWSLWAVSLSHSHLLSSISFNKLYYPHQGSLFQWVVNCGINWRKRGKTIYESEKELKL